MGRGGIAGRSGPPHNRNAEVHGLSTLNRVIQKRERRRHSPLDRRTRAARNAEAVRAGIIADKGGVDAMTTLQLVTVELYARELSRLDEIDQAIEKFLRRRPEVRRNPRAMETLLSYRRGTVASLIKLAPLIGMERQAKAPTITDLLHEEQPQEPADQGTETGNETEDPTT